MSQLVKSRPMSQVNLLPPETREQQRTRKHVGVVAMVGVAVVGLLVLFSSTLGAKVTDLQDQIDQVTATNAELQQTATNLQHFEDLRSELTGRLGLVQGALSGGVRWSHVLQDISGAMPAGVWLSSVNATMGASASSGSTAPVAPAPAPTVAPSPVAPATTGTTTTPAAPGTTGAVAAPTGQIVASLTFQGWALDVPSVSKWLENMDSVDGWANAWVSQTQKSVQGNAVVYQFSSTVDITADYLTKNGVQP